MKLGDLLLNERLMFPHSARSAGLDVGRSGILRAVSGKSMVCLDDGVPVSTKPKPFTVKAKNVVFGKIRLFSPLQCIRNQDRQAPERDSAFCLKFGVIQVCAHDHYNKLLHLSYNSHHTYHNATV
jgi:hypothetical protein